MKEQQLQLFHNNQQQKENLSHRRHIIKIPLDTLILISIMIIFGAVFSFSIGVQKGRKEAATIKLNQNISENPAPSGKTLLSHKIITVGRNNNSKKEINSKNKYVVQVASCLKENTAKVEKEHLERAGFSVKLLKKGKYVVVYVGGFTDEREAKKAQLLLRKKYNDCRSEEHTSELQSH